MKRSRATQKSQWTEHFSPESRNHNSFSLPRNETICEEERTRVRQEGPFPPLIRFGDLRWRVPFKVLWWGERGPVIARGCVCNWTALGRAGPGLAQTCIVCPPLPHITRWVPFRPVPRTERKRSHCLVAHKCRGGGSWKTEWSALQEKRQQ